MSLRVCIAGATGWAGSSIAKAVHQADDMELIGAVSPSHRNENLGDVIGIRGLDLAISGSIEKALETETDVMIDFTAPHAVKNNVIESLRRKVHAVVGTSGMSDADYVEIDTKAREQSVGVLAAGNFALTAVLMMKFAEMAAKHIPSWEIIDYADAYKPDAPSGTIRELVNRLARVRRPEIAFPVDKTAGARETRGATMEGMQVHALRLPGYIITAEAIFGAPDEKLIIRHEAGASAEPYVAGVLMAVRKVRSFTGLRRGLDSIMDF